MNSCLDPAVPERGGAPAGAAEAVPDCIVGESPSMREALDLLARVAPTDASVLITGETGTGKDLFARALHAGSPRRRGPMVKLDCGAIPESLMESELFGHERGAFTGAVGARPGIFEQANRGMVFLDEVGELSAAAQTRLLRVIEDRVVQRVGSCEPRAVDFRLVSATHRDLDAGGESTGIRADLFHRIQVVRIHLPPLRERGEGEIVRLLQHFARLHGARHQRPVRRINAGTLDFATAYPWPGNVRELSHAVESAVVLSPDGELHWQHFNLRKRGHRGAHPFHDEPSLAELERRYLEWLLERHGGRRAEVARVAGIGRNTLWRRLKTRDGRDRPGGA